MAQRIVNGEQYEVLLVKGGEDGGALPVALPSGTVVTIGSEVEIKNDSGDPLSVRGEVSVARLQGAQAFAVTPNDATDLTAVTSALYVGFTGNVSLICSGDTNAVTFFNIAGGSILPLRVKRVRSTGTTASGIVGLL
jgi:hypothetical protein